MSGFGQLVAAVHLSYRCTILVPPNACLIVMRARVNKAVGVMIVRQVRVVGASTPCKLQHNHARCVDRSPQGFHICCDDTEVLSHDEGGLVSKALAHAVEESCARALTPRADHRRVTVSVYCPVARKTPEVINASLVVHLNTRCSLAVLSGNLDRWLFSSCREVDRKRSRHYLPWVHRECSGCAQLLTKTRKDSHAKAWLDMRVLAWEKEAAPATSFSVHQPSVSGMWTITGQNIQSSTSAITLLPRHSSYLLAFANFLDTRRS
jgi:hypothetical protein